MMDTNGTVDRVTQRIRWTARIWGTLILAVVLMILFGNIWGWITGAGPDPNAAGDYPPIENLPPLFALLSALGLGLAWRWEGIGGGIAVLFNLAGIPVLLSQWPLAGNFPEYLIAPYGTWLAIAVPGILFLICWRRSTLHPRSTKIRQSA